MIKRLQSVNSLRIRKDNIFTIFYYKHVSLDSYLNSSKGTRPRDLSHNNEVYYSWKYPGNHFERFNDSPKTI